MIEKVDLRTARYYAKMTVTEVAKKMGKCQSWLTHIENNVRDIPSRTLEKLVALYGLTMNDIFLPPLTTKSRIKTTKKRIVKK